MGASPIRVPWPNSSVAPTGFRQRNSSHAACCSRAVQSQPTSIIDRWRSVPLLVEGKVAAYIRKSQEIPVASMDNGPMGKCQRRDLGVGDQVTGSPAGRLKQRNYLMHVIGGRLQ